MAGRPESRRLWVATLLASLRVASPALADVVVIPPDRDNTVYEEGPLSNGAGDYFFAGLTNDDTRRRGLLHFDVAGSLPTGSTIDGVTLTLRLSRTKNSTVDVHLHVLTGDWGEAGSHADAEEGAGDAAQPGDATWTHAMYDTVAWTVPGGISSRHPAPPQRWARVRATTRGARRRWQRTCRGGSTPRRPTSAGS